jgi:hypothetical protein
VGTYFTCRSVCGSLSHFSGIDHPHVPPSGLVAYIPKALFTGSIHAWYDFAVFPPANTPTYGPYLHSHTQRIYSPSDLHDSDMLDAAEKFASILPQNTSALSSLSPTFSTEPEVDYMIAVETDPDTKLPSACRYYIAHHGKRVLYWLHEFDAKDILKELSGFFHREQFSVLHRSLTGPNVWLLTPCA